MTQPLSRLILVLSILGCGVTCGMDQKDDNNLTVQKALKEDQIIPFSGFQSHEIKDFFSCVPQYLDLKTLSSFSQINHFARIVCHPYKLDFFRNAPPFICPENEIVPILNSLREIDLYERFLYDVTVLEDGVELKATDEDKCNFHTKNNLEIIKILNCSNKFDYSIVFQRGRGATYRNEISTRHQQLLNSGFMHNLNSVVQSVRKDYIYKYGYAVLLVGSFAILCSDYSTNRNQELYQCGFSQSSPNCIQFYGRTPANIIGYHHSQLGAHGCLPFGLSPDIINQIFDINCQMIKEDLLWRVSMTEFTYLCSWLMFFCRYFQIFIF